MTNSSNDAVKNLKVAPKQTYEDLKDQVEKPYSERSKLSIGRGGQAITPRKYHLTEQQLAKLEAERAATGGTINPFKGRVGLYNSQVEALIQLGADEWHSLKTVVGKIEEIMTDLPGKDGKTAWETVLNRSSKTGASKPKDINGRIMQNYKVLQRIAKGGNDRNPYGEKLRQVCLAVDIKFEPLEGATDPSLGTWYYKLNTQFSTPDEVVPSYSNPVAKRGRRPSKKNKEKADQA